MKWSRDLSGAEPILKDMPVYDSSVIATGELLMLGATAFTAGADAGLALVNAVPSTVGANQAVKAVGVAQGTITTSGNGLKYSLASTVSVATAANTTANTGCAYTKVIINPLAVYRTLVSQDNTADALSVASSASTNQIAITGVPASAFNGSLVYFCGTAGPNFGSLRRIVSSATAGTQMLDAVLTATATTADKVVVIADRSHNPHILSTNTVTTTGANTGTTVGQSTVGGYAATNVVILDNIVEGGTFGGGMALLRPEIQSQTNIGGGAPKTIKLWQDIVLLNHLFNYHN